MCHMCANQFCDFGSLIDWYCLKKFIFEPIHIRHTIFFEFWRKKTFSEIFSKFRWIYNGILIEKLNFLKIQNWVHILCATCVQINFMTLRAFLNDIVSKYEVLSQYTSGTPFFLSFGEGIIFLRFSPNSAGFTTGFWSKNWIFFKLKIGGLLVVPHVCKSNLWL